MAAAFGWRFGGRHLSGRACGHRQTEKGCRLRWRRRDKEKLGKRGSVAVKAISFAHKQYDRGRILVRVRRGMSRASEHLRRCTICTGLLITAGPAIAMVPDVSKLAARTAEAEGCLVVDIEEKGQQDGFLMFSVTCAEGSQSADGDVACKGGACTFHPSPPVQAGNQQ